MAAYSAVMGRISTSPHTAFFVITLSTYSFLTIQFSIINAADLENGLQESRERERESTVGNSSKKSVTGYKQSVLRPALGIGLYITSAISYYVA